MQEEVADAYANPVAGASLTLSLTSGGTLGGTLTQTTSSAGIATFSDLSVAAAGTYTLKVTLSSPSLSATSNSFSISPVTTTTALSSSLNPSPAGTSVTFTATVTGNSPTGIVTFTDGQTTLGTGSVTNGTATYSTSALTSGSHTIAASYGGDSANAAGTSPTLIQTVQGAPTANAQSAATLMNQPVAVTLTGSDPNTPPLPLTYTITTAPNSWHAHRNRSEPDLYARGRVCRCGQLLVQCQQRLPGEQSGDSVPDHQSSRSDYDHRCPLV